MTSLDRLARMARITRRPILGNGKTVKMVNQIGAQGSGKMLMRTWPKNDANIKMVNLTSAVKLQNW